jgi:hypothetical protein
VPQLTHRSSVKPKGVRPAWEGLTSPGRDSLGEAIAPAAYRHSRQSYRAPASAMSSSLGSCWRRPERTSPYDRRWVIGRALSRSGAARDLRFLADACDVAEPNAARPQPAGHRFDRPMNPELDATISTLRPHWLRLVAFGA